MIVRLFKFLAKVWRADEFGWPDPTPSPLHPRSNPMKITDEAVRAGSVKMANMDDSFTWLSDEDQDKLIRAALEAALPHIMGEQDPVTWTVAGNLLKRLREENERLRKALRTVDTWAEQRCPCRNEEPNPCPLCLADANNPKDICLSAENTLPAHVLSAVRAALSEAKR